MKFTFKTVLLLIATIFITAQAVAAQTLPTVSAKYTVAQIDEMHKEHKIYRPRDIHSAPQDVAAKFAADFPKARDIEWEQSPTLYEVEFEIGMFGRNDYKAYYDMKGNLIMYKAEISSDELPAIVRNAALAKYPNYKIDDIDKIVKGSETTYTVELEKGKIDVRLFLKHDGTIISEYID